VIGVRGIRAGAVAAIATLGLVASSASTALAEGDGASRAPWTLNGQVIDPSTAAARDLACVQSTPDQPTRCYGSQVELKAAAGAAEHRASRTDGASLVATDYICGWGDDLTVFENLYSNSNTAGWSLGLANRQVWYDLQGAYNDAVSSYYMGAHSGHIASDAYGAGLGYFYPGPTSVGDCEGNMSRYGFGSGTWNNQASSRYRN
jgi:hypothetical protein